MAIEILGLIAIPYRYQWFCFIDASLLYLFRMQLLHALIIEGSNESEITILRFQPCFGFGNKPNITKTASLINGTVTAKDLKTSLKSAC